MNCIRPSIWVGTRFAQAPLVWLLLSRLQDNKHQHFRHRTCPIDREERKKTPGRGAVAHTAGIGAAPLDFGFFF